MDPQHAKTILDASGAVGTALRQDVIDAYNLSLSIEWQINRMQEIVDRMKKLGNDILMEYDEDSVNAEQFIMTMANALRPLAKSSTRLESARDGLQLTLTSLKVAEKAANKFANKIPDIPKV